jgi:hypothetical protein
MKFFLITVVTSFLLIKVASAQPIAVGTEIASQLLELETVKAINNFNGKMGDFTVTQKSDTSYYHVKGMSFFNPVVISVQMANPKIKADLSLHRDFWSTSEWQSTTDTEGAITYACRSSGDIGIRIITPPKTKFYLSIWCGDEITPALSSPFKKSK